MSRSVKYLDMVNRFFSNLAPVVGTLGKKRLPN